jgi:hypothetical protein
VIPLAAGVAVGTVEWWYTVAALVPLFVGAAILAWLLLPDLIDALADTSVNERAAASSVRDAVAGIPRPSATGGCSSPCWA